MRLLFISRKHPPSVGGMQNLSYQLITGAKKYAHVAAITWGRSQKGLPLFLIYAFIAGLIRVARGIDLIHVGDPLLSPLGWLLGRFAGVPVVTTAHGLDVTWPPKWYQRLIPQGFLQRLDHIVCISRSTRDACIRRGLSPESCSVILPGVDLRSDPTPRDEARAWLSRKTGFAIDERPILLTVGRLVPRKGVVWFVDAVLPHLSRESAFRYVVVGDGVERAHLEAVVAERGLGPTVALLGEIDAASLRLAYAAADLFVMPNVPVNDDVEGFGLVALEAASAGLAVVAADLEGVRDAVVPGETGILLPAADAASWVSAVDGLLADPERIRVLGKRARATVEDGFTWDRMVQAYIRRFGELTSIG